MLLGCGVLGEICLCWRRGCEKQQRWRGSCCLQLAASGGYKLELVLWSYGRSMDMLLQLPGALYRLRSARLPFSSFGAPPAAANPFGIPHARQLFLGSEKFVRYGSSVVSRESLKFEVFGSRDHPGFRVYSGRRRCDFASECWNKTLGQRSACPSGFVHHGRSLLVVVAARGSKRKEEHVSLEVSEGIGDDDESEKPSFKERAHLKRQVRSESELSRGSRSSQVDSDITESNRWRFKSKNNQSRSGSPTSNQGGGSPQRPKEVLATAGIKNLVSRTKNISGRPSSGKAASIASGSSFKRIGRSPRVADVRLRSDNSSSAYSSANGGSRTQDSSVPEKTSFVKVTVSASQVSPGTMNSQQRAGGNKQGEKERRPKQNEKKKEKHFPAEAVLRRDLNMCSKGGDVLRALELYDQSVADGTVKWNQYNFNILLYLCSSASLGTLTARKSGSDRAESERLRVSAAEQTRNEEGSQCRDSGLEQQDNKENGETPLNDDGAASASTSIVLSPEVMEQVANRGFEIYEHMKRLKVSPNEATLTAVARLAVARGDGDLAFQMVKEMAALNLAPKLRSYSPALFTYCKNKAVKQAFEVDSHMLSAGVQPEEPELAALLLLCVDTGLADEVYKLLHRLRVRIRALSPATVAAIEKWFSQEAAILAGKDRNRPDSLLLEQALVAGGGGWHGLGWLGEGEWKQTWTSIDSEGVCLSCREKLVTIDLDPQETDNFAQSLADLACTREAKPNDFKKFQEWLERHGPFDAIVDGANIGLYNQNFAQGGFNFHQLNAVVTALQDQGLAKKPPLIFLHHARTKFGAATTAQSQQLLNKWRSNNALYTTPNGSNDDWYWMYAAVKNKCLLVTNDEMRDHLFQLLGTDFFPKWKERHQARFTCTTRGPQFHLPPPYSIVIQESEKGSWHVPQMGGDDIEAPREWLCVTRPSLSTASTPENSTLVETAERPVELSSASVELTLQGFVDDQKSSSLKSHSQESGTEEASARCKRARLNLSSATLARIRAADRRSDNGPIAFEI